MLAAGDGVLGLVALERPEPGWRPLHDVREQRALDLRAVDGGAGRARHRRDRADVIEVAVGDQDRLDLHPERVDRGQQALGLIAGVDEHGALGVGRGAHDVGVLLHEPDGERPHVQSAHRDAAFPPPPWLAFLR